MPIYLQIFLIIIAIIAFYFLTLLATGWGIRKLCFTIIREMEDQGATSATRAVHLPDSRGNFFKRGFGNYRPKALQILITDKIVLKTSNGKYFLNKDKLAEIKTIKRP